MLAQDLDFSGGEAELRVRDGGGKGGGHGGLHGLLGAGAMGWMLDLGAAEVRLQRQSQVLWQWERVGQP